MSTSARHALPALALALLLPLVGCSRSGDDVDADVDRSATPSEGAALVAGGAADGPDDSPQVLAISVDALNPNALVQLGHAGAPALWRLVDEGASTLNARDDYEQTVTLPNHTTMVTGRRIDARHGGHGVVWNDDRPRSTVQRAAGHGVASVFSVAHAAGLSTALFAAKTKFSLFSRSWPGGIDRTTIVEERDDLVARRALADLVRADRGFTFLHLGGADKAGHASGFMGARYLDAVRGIDALIGSILDAADSTPELADLTVVLTADHGGAKGQRDHSDRTRLANYRVPFAVWGPDVTTADLYDINPTRLDPGTGRPRYAGRQPVRNGEVANLSLELLGLGPVPGSEFDADQDLVVR